MHRKIDKNLLDDFCKTSLKTLENAHRYRVLTPIASVNGARIEIEMEGESINPPYPPFLKGDRASLTEDETSHRVQGTISASCGKEVELENTPKKKSPNSSTTLINFSSNDYLGLAQHPALIKAACEATERFGTGSGASRLVSGTLALHTALETDIAAWKGSESALVVGSGYHANIGAIPALASAGDVILSDALNHASLIDGCRLSKARTRVFPHNDMNALETALKQNEYARHRLIVTESVFSMDGDLAPIDEILALAARYDAWVYLDEAHATGILDPVKMRLPNADLSRLIQMGTLGKALGSFGAYIAGSRLLCEFLVNRMRSFIFGTALPPAPVAAARAAIALLKEDPSHRNRLFANMNAFHEKIGAHLDLKKPVSPIIPIIIGSEEATLNLAQFLKSKGIYLQAIRPPTVPDGTSRLRLTLSAAHTEHDLEVLKTALMEEMAVGAYRIRPL